MSQKLQVFIFSGVYVNARHKIVHPLTSYVCYPYDISLHNFDRAIIAGFFRQVARHSETIYPIARPYSDLPSIWTSYSPQPQTMTTHGQFSTRNPTIKRILKEASELAENPSPDLHAEPLEANLFEWHFTIRGPPSPSSFAGGIYHGRIVLPLTYPLRPPSFRFLTPSGRFEVNREICLSISGHHEETWQPAWGIRTALTAIRSFMDTDVKGQVGGLQADDNARKRFAKTSVEWTCGACRKSNKVIMKEREEACKESDATGVEKKEDVVPEELRLAYREDLAAGSEKEVKEAVDRSMEQSAEVTTASTSSTQSLSSTATPQARAPRRQSDDAWIDKAIYTVAALLALLVARKVLLFL